MVCRQLQVTALHAFISDSVHFFSRALAHLSGAVPSAESIKAQRNGASPDSQEATKPGLASTGQHQVHAPVLEVLLENALLVIPQASCAAEGFGIVMPRVQLVPRASMGWVAEALHGVHAECAPPSSACAWLVP